MVTASALFDGHDAAINIIRRMLQASGAEVIHIGHNRSAEEIVRAAVQEDVQGIAVSSYQGGHVAFYKYMFDLLHDKGAGHIRIFGGGGGVIIPSEIDELQQYGVARIFSPEDGRRLGLQGMIDIMLQACDYSTISGSSTSAEALAGRDDLAVARWMTTAESIAEASGEEADRLARLMSGIKSVQHTAPVIGITGTGGAGKSSLTDELVRRFLRLHPDMTIAVLSVDPTKRRTGGALLGDRIRMNAVHSERVYMRSFATRGSGSELAPALKDAVIVAKAAGFDLIVAETSGIGQADSRITGIADLSVYVMTSEFGAPSQLEKIEMIDDADLIVINKFDRRGSEDALREVKKQVQRSRRLFDADWKEMPVYGTNASRFNDEGVNAFFRALTGRLYDVCGFTLPAGETVTAQAVSSHTIIPDNRSGYLNEIVETVRSYKCFADREAETAGTLYRIAGAADVIRQAGNEAVLQALEQAMAEVEGRLSETSRIVLQQWESTVSMYKANTLTLNLRGQPAEFELATESLSGLRIPKVVLPNSKDWGQLLSWVYKENVPGKFPYTAGVFPLKRKEEEPKRQFAGEGSPERTNRRFHYLSEGEKAKRLSTAFDSVTLYGEDPDLRPDIYGKIGESGVSVCTLDDMKKLYAGFDLCHPLTSVSMTINGPAPILLAMFLNTAIDQELDRFTCEQGREPTPEERQSIRKLTLRTVRGTVQADILKEDQGQNTCIFSIPFALKMMGDIQQYFIDNEVRNYYSVSISGYHIAEAGANPVTQLAFTLANGFTYVEYYLSRGMHIDEVAPNLSFFFSNGLDPEYSVIGRVARRIWAVVMRDKYGANERSQKLKYHIQTSGRSLHAQEVDFNDIRTTLQALMAMADHCNSLHTNAYDEAITTPSEQSVRRAMAIQLILNRELGLMKNENVLQGSFFIEYLTDLVEDAVLEEFERLHTRGGVLGAMESQYQRGKIQDESMNYEMKKHSGEFPIVGVNTFLNPDPHEPSGQLQLARATKQEKDGQIAGLRLFQEKHRPHADEALNRLKETAFRGGNVFAELMNTVRTASLGQITRALYEAGGKYRRNM
ncbi:fused isobutyryl-CoA mutase/GTPase IcmF [Paenibacillus tarimensis]